MSPWLIVSQHIVFLCYFAIMSVRFKIKLNHLSNSTYLFILFMCEIHVVEFPQKWASVLLFRVEKFTGASDTRKWIKFCTKLLQGSSHKESLQHGGHFKYWLVTISIIRLMHSTHFRFWIFHDMWESFFLLVTYEALKHRVNLAFVTRKRCTHCYRLLKLRNTGPLGEPLNPGEADSSAPTTTIVTRMTHGTTAGNNIVLW